MNNTENFKYNEIHNVTISEYTNTLNSTTIMPQQDIYINTIANIHDMDSLIQFYQYLFDGHPMVLLTCVFVGLYFGCVLIEYQKKRSTKVVNKK